MKKCLFKFVYIVLILFPIVAYAEGIENFYINATLESNGDLRVREYFNLEGEYNGFRREIYFANSDAYPFRPELAAYGGSSLHNGNGIRINEIRAVDVDPDFDFSNVNGDRFAEVEEAKKGDYGVFTKSSLVNGYIYTIFLPSDEDKAFYLDYTITNLAILHNDVGELGWNIFTSLSESVSNLQIVINFPNNQNEFRVWAHGPLNGVVNPKGKNTLVANVQNLYSYTSLDIRAAFDKEVIPLSSKRTNVTALEKILYYEEDQAAKANYTRQQEDYKIQEEAQREISYCYSSPYRSCYNRALSLVERIHDEKVKANLTEELVELNKIVTEQEERTAKESVKFAEDFKGYSWYAQAYDDTIILTNEELKNELLNRLEVVKEQITEQEEEKYQKQKTYIIGIIIAIFCIIIYIYYYHDREYRTSFNAPYVREIPNHYSPSTVNYLFNRKISNDAVSAEILNLINKGVLECKKITTKKDKEDYTISKNNSYKESLSSKENAIIKLVLGTHASVKLSEVKKRASSSYTSFLNRWDSVMEKCITEAIDEDIYVDDELAKYNSKKSGKAPFIKVFLVVIASMLITSILFLIPGFILLFIATSISNYDTSLHLDIKKNFSKVCAIAILFILLTIQLINLISLAVSYHFIEVQFIYPIAGIILAIVALVYVYKCRKRTETGIYEYKRWKAFKHFLLDFGKMDIKEVGEVKLWNEYLVYATVLGCADKVERAMKLKVKDLNLAETDIFLTDIHIYSDLTHNINRGIREAHNKAITSQMASSSGGSSSGGGSWSSGGGGGGGFSSGGGSFGGGGGGGRF